MEKNRLSNNEEVLADALGRIVGRVSWKRERGRMLSRAEKQWCVDFVSKISKQTGVKPMAKAVSGVDATERVNAVVLAGIIKKIDLQTKYAWLLLDVNGRSSIPVKAFDKEILAKLAPYIEGDFIKVKAYLSQSKNERSNQYELMAVIAELKGNPTGNSKPAQSRIPVDDDLPF